MNILDKANDILGGERNEQYGDPVYNFKKISNMVYDMTNRYIAPEDCCSVLMAVKLVRESYKHKEDNLIDLAAYAAIRQMIIEEKENNQESQF
jgi:hypothetical protein